MTAQDLYYSSHRLRQPRRAELSGIGALVAGVLVAVGLALLAQGTVPAADMPDWHGNVARAALTGGVPR